MNRWAMTGVPARASRVGWVTSVGFADFCSKACLLVRITVAGQDSLNNLEINPLSGRLTIGGCQFIRYDHLQKIFSGRQ